MKCYSAVVTTKGYCDIAKVLLHSLKKNGGLDIPFVVITSKIGKYALTVKEKKELKKIYGDVRYHYVDIEKYNKYGKSNPKYWSIEIFSMYEWDSVIYMDADCLCVGSMAGLDEYRMGMTKERQRPNFSAGLIVLNKIYRCENTYNEILKEKGNPARFGHDQRVYNTFFEGNIQELDRKWHCKVDELEHPIEYYSLIHYWLKPTDERHRPRLSKSLIDLWESYANK